MPGAHDSRTPRLGRWTRVGRHFEATPARSKPSPRRSAPRRRGSRSADPAAASFNVDGETATDLERLRKLTHVLDEAFRVPGTSLHVGLDPVLGLLPGVGDLVGAAVTG